MIEMVLGTRSRAGHALPRVLLGVSAACTLAYAGFIAAAQPAEVSDAVGLWVYHGALAFASLTCFARAALVRNQRIAWIAFGLGLLSWTAGDVYWTLAFTDLDRVPYPSIADAGYLAALPCFYVGIALLIKRRIGHFTAASWLDGAIGGLAAASIGTAVLAPALVGLTEGDPAAVLTNLAYPLGDILLIAFIVGALVVSGVRGAGEFLAIAAGLIAWTLADGIYLYQEATSGYTGGLAGRAVAGRRPADGGRRRALVHPPIPAAARLQLADRLPLGLRRDRGRGPGLGSLQPPARGLDLALGRHPRRGDRPDGDQLPREHRPDGGPA